MKKILIAMVFLLITGCAQTNVMVKEFQSENIIHFSRFLALDDTAGPDEYAVYLEKGDTFPLELTLKSEFMGFAEKRVNMVVKERVYFFIKMPAGTPQEKAAWLKNLGRENLAGMSEAEKQDLMKDFMVYVSSDGMHWGAYNDPGTIKELFGIKGGSLSLGMGMDKKDGIWSELVIELLSR